MSCMKSMIESTTRDAVLCRLRIALHTCANVQGLTEVFRRQFVALVLPF